MFQSLDLNTASERGAVQGFTLQTIARLSPNDAALPQVQAVCEMVKRGIGVHHGGLLPILKEMVEILFSRNLIKVLMSTETLAMGVNIQIRAVVFNSIRKHDGTEFRVLQAGEYTQMAGRAGRRGLDTVGTVIMCCFGEVPPPIAILKNMLMGQSTMLRSQFRLTYNMILNLLRVEEMSVENMIKRSFSEFATQRALTANEYPKLLAKGQKTLEKLEEQFKAKRSQMVGADDLEDYFSTCSELLASNRQLLSFVLEAGDNGVDNILQPGRLLLVSASRKHGVVHAPALVLKGPGSPNTGKAGLGMSTGKPDDSCVCMVLLPESYIMKEGTGASTKKAGSVGYVGSSKQRHYGVFEIKLENILLVSSTKKKIDTKVLYKETGGAASSAMSGFGGGAHANAFAGMAPRGGGGSFDNPFAGMKMKGKKNDDDLGYGKKASAVSSESDVVEKAMETLLEAEAQEKESGLAPMDLRDTVKRGSEVAVFRNHCQIMEETVVRMRSYNAHTHPNIEQYFTILERKRSLKEKVDALNHLLSNESLQLFPDFLQRKAVLSSMGYLDENEAVTVKGRVACEVNTCEELIATEMVFEGILNDLEPAEIVAALSSMVYQQKSDDEEFDKEMPETLLECCNRMKAIALDLGQVQKDHGLQIDPTEYANGALKFGLVHVVYEWALGVPFASICELTDVQEGSIVRCITRLDELCREIRNCARVVGNPTLYRKMEAASIAIKRDIVFTSSLYVS
jgi:antiviral helicase SKI2